MWHQHQHRFWILKIGFKVGVAALNWLLVRAKPGRLLTSVISSVVRSSPLRVAKHLKATGLAMLVRVAPDTDAQGAFVLSEAFMHQSGYK